MCRSIYGPDFDKTRKGMVALPFYTYRKVTEKPFLKHFNPHPHTIGEHIRKKRIERGLLQKDVALMFDCSEDTITGWESSRGNPNVVFYPKIIWFLGYYPFEHETDTLAGKIKQIRYSKGLGKHQFAKLLHVSFKAVKRWECGKPILNTRLREVIRNEWQSLPFHSQHTVPA